MKSRRFQQKFDETFYEAWDRFNDLLRGCPHHGFSELHQLDTFYNALNSNDQDSLNSAAGGNFLDKMPRECLKIIESKSKVRQSRNKAVVAKNAYQLFPPSNLLMLLKLKDLALRPFQSSNSGLSGLRYGLKSNSTSGFPPVSESSANSVETHAEQASSYGSGTLVVTLVTNPKEDLKDCYPILEPNVAPVVTPVPKDQFSISITKK
ncbi:hypothetical protein Tco_0195278 [Tanacetum coccineum]